MTTRAETSENINLVMRDAKEKYGSSCFAFVFDNASNMVGAAKLLKRKLWHSRCMIHCGNFLSKDLLNDSIRINVTMIQEPFRSSKLSKLIEQAGGKRPKSPSNTRWCFQRDMYVNFIQNIEIYKVLAKDKDNKISEPIKRL